MHPPKSVHWELLDFEILVAKQQQQNLREIASDQIKNHFSDSFRQRCRRPNISKSACRHYYYGYDNFLPFLLLLILDSGKRVISVSFTTVSICKKESLVKHLQQFKSLPKRRLLGKELYYYSSCQDIVYSIFRRIYSIAVN